jgi:hypothetical protein
MDKAKSERIKAIDQQVGELLQERWKLLNSSEDTVSDELIGAASGLGGVPLPDYKNVVHRGDGNWSRGVSG